MASEGLVNLARMVAAAGLALGLLAPAPAGFARPATDAAAPAAEPLIRLWPPSEAVESAIQARAVREPVAPGRVSIQALQDTERRVQALLPKLLAATVGISQSAGGQGSGVIVSADGLILTAGHVSGAPGREVVIHFSDGRTARGKTLGRNKSDDSGMIRLLPPDDSGDAQDVNVDPDESTRPARPYPFVEVGGSGGLARGEWVIALGHPGGWRRDRPAVLRVGRVARVGQWVVTDAVLVGGDSGGPLFDLQGRLVGIHSRIGNSTASNMHVPVDKINAAWDRLVAGEDWSDIADGLARALNAAGPYLGIEVEELRDPPGNAPGLRVTLVEQSGPAAGAGLMAGDVIHKINDRTIDTRDRLVQVLRRYNVGDTVRLEVTRDDGAAATLRVKLGRRPTGG